MIARRLPTLVTIATTLGFALGLIPAISDLAPLTQLTPSTQGIAAKLGASPAAGFSLALMFTVLTTILYAIVNQEDSAAAEIFQWYGCLLFGGALALACFGLAAFLWSEGFPAISHGRSARWLYQTSLSHELWLYFASLLLFLNGSLGLYLMAKISHLAKRSQR